MNTHRYVLEVVGRRTQTLKSICLYLSSNFRSEFQRTKYVRQNPDYRHQYSEG